MVQFACKQACMLCISRDHARCTLPQRSKNRLNHHCRTAQARAPIKIRGIKTLINCNNPIRAPCSTHALSAEMKVLTASQPKADWYVSNEYKLRVRVFFLFTMSVSRLNETDVAPWKWFQIKLGSIHSLRLLTTSQRVCTHSEWEGTHCEEWWKVKPHVKEKRKKERACILLILCISMFIYGSGRFWGYRRWCNMISMYPSYARCKDLSIFSHPTI